MSPPDGIRLRRASPQKYQGKGDQSGSRFSRNWSRPSTASSVMEASRLAGEDLLAHEAVVGEVEGELQHPLGLRTLAHDLRGDLQRLALEIGVVGDDVDG